MATTSFEKKQITKKSKNISEWYNDVVLKAELADYGPARGTMIIRPWGYSLWEKIQAEFDQKIKAAGVENAYFPLFIPEKFLKKEKEHVEGFSPQLAVVTIGGGKKLAEKLIVRPTSETIMYEAFSRWIKSWRDLPLKINQWANVVRWELRTVLFLRTTEFLWQEGHTAHATHEEARKTALWALSLYQRIYQELLAIPVLVGIKSAAERFAGAAETYTVEALMPDGRALQGATSHDLGQNFAKPFGITFQNKEGKNEYVWQTSWGISTRSLGALVLVHGDDNGLVLPPKIAPLQVVIIPIWGKENKKIDQMARKIESQLSAAGFRVAYDDRKEQSPGWKFNEWELKGVPLRIEIGEEEVRSGQPTVIRRDTFEKSKMEVGKLLDEMQKNLYQRAEKFLEENTHQASSFSEFRKIMKEKRGFIWAFWCGKESCEAKIKAETKATARLLPLRAKEEKGKCLVDGDKALFRWLFAQAY